MLWHQIIIFIPCDWIPNGDKSQDSAHGNQALGLRRTNSLRRTSSRANTIDRVVSKTFSDIQTAVASGDSKDAVVAEQISIPNTPGDRD